MTNDKVNRGMLTINNESDSQSLEKQPNFSFIKVATAADVNRPMSQMVYRN